MERLDSADRQMSSSMWGEFKPFSGTFLMKGYHPLAGGLLDDSSPLMWTKVNVQLREPNLLVITHADSSAARAAAAATGGSIGYEEEFSRGDSYEMAGRELAPSPYDQTLRVDKQTSVTPIKKKNYSSDPSKSIVLEAFAVEKSKDWGVLLDGLKYKKLKFAVLPSQHQQLADFRAALIALCDKVREIPEEVRGSHGGGGGGLLTGLLNRVGGGGGRHQAF